MINWLLTYENDTFIHFPNFINAILLNVNFSKYYLELTTVSNSFKDPVSSHICQVQVL